MRRPPKLLQGSRKDRHHLALLIPPCERKVCPQFFLCCLVEVEQFLFKSVLFARLLLLLKKSGFPWWLLVCSIWHFWVASFSDTQLGIYEAKRKGNSFLCCSWVLKSLPSLTFSLQLSESSYVCFTLKKFF